MNTPERHLKPTEVADRLFSCASEALTTSRESRRAELIEEGLSLSCNFLTRLNHHIERYLEAALQQSELNPEGTPVSLIDLARSHDELDIFLSKDTLGDFLDAVADNLLLQGYINDERIKDLKKTVLNSFDKMMEQPLKSAELIKNFLIIRAICCKPPEDPDSGKPVGTPPAGPRTGEVWKAAERALGILANLAAVAALFLALQQEPKPNATSPQPNIPHTPLRLKMLILLLLSVAANEALGLGLLPLEMQEIVDGGSDAEDVVKQLEELARKNTKFAARAYA